MEPNYKELYTELFHDYRALNWRYGDSEIECERLKSLLKLRNNQLYRARKQLKELACNSPSNSLT